jgi:hypothetical protein
MFIAIKNRIIRETNNKGWQFCQSSATQAVKLNSKKRTETDKFMNENGEVGPWSFLYAFFVTNASACLQPGQAKVGPGPTPLA